MIESILIRLTPNEDMNDLLRAYSTIDGIPTMECRWWEQGKCLSVFRKRETDGHWYSFKPLKDPKGFPRQLNHQDLLEIRALIHESEQVGPEMVARNRWYRGVEDFNAEVDRKSKAQHDDDNEQIHKMELEMERKGMCWHGVRKDVDCPTCRIGQALAEGKIRYA